MGIFEPFPPLPRLRSCATPAGHLCDTNQQRHSHVIGFYVMLSSPGVALLLRVAAADSVYLFSVEVNSWYSAGGGIKASRSAELIKRSILLREKLPCFFRERPYFVSVYIYIYIYIHRTLRRHLTAPPATPHEREWSQLEVFPARASRVERTFEDALRNCALSPPLSVVLLSLFDSAVRQFPLSICTRRYIKMNFATKVADRLSHAYCLSYRVERKLTILILI